MNIAADSAPSVPHVLAHSDQCSLAKVLATIKHHYREEIALGAKACLGAITSLSLRNRDHCLALVLEGGSGKGKSVIVRS